MCGIAGLFDISSQRGSEEYINITNNMSKALAHRGPDSNGVWADVEYGVTLGHRRLAIIDISHEGHQPMISSYGRYVITYNGEIYNFLVIRRELEEKGYKFRGHSDTEVILTAIEEWGFEKAVKKFIGMFAFALWDKKEKNLLLTRDRIGEKPLYYGWIGKTFVFASELKAFHAFPGFNREIDRRALFLYLKYNYIPSPYSIYKNIFKLRPGSFLTLNQESEPGSVLENRSYWSALDIAKKGIENRFTGNEHEALVQLGELLKDAVAKQMISDVPLGAFLSGGIDSSTIVALMQAQSSIPVKTFSIGSNESSFNEAHFAKAVARHLGTDHTELYVSPEEAMEVIPKLPDIYDEPFADSSQIPTFLVAQLTRKKVTVSLSGDAGDELFGGYNRYFWGRNILKGTKWMPGPVKKLTAASLKMLSTETWDSIYNLFEPGIPRALRLRLPGDKIHKLAAVLDANNPAVMYDNLVSSWKHPDNVVKWNDQRLKNIASDESTKYITDFSEWMMYKDLITYLPDDILVKVDRACMAVSLESRVPYLDHRIIEFSWTLPLEMKIKKDKGKLLLRSLLYKYVPPELIERPKIGFGIPVDIWLRGPLKEWAETLLEEKRLKTEGFFDVKEVRDKWNEHLTGVRNWNYQLWAVLMFEAWYEKWHR